MAFSLFSRLSSPHSFRLWFFLTAESAIRSNSPFCPSDDIYRYFSRIAFFAFSREIFPFYAARTFAGDQAKVDIRRPD
ncbi:hypothetical protein ACNKHK_28050 [Shigella flexneri]